MITDVFLTLLEEAKEITEYETHQKWIRLGVVELMVNFCQENVADFHGKSEHFK